MESKSKKTEVKEPIVIHMGKKKKKHIKQYHKGKGKMFNEVKQVIEQLNTQHKDSDTIQPVVVISKKKEKIKFGI